jgi:hypothetical protein
MQMRLFSTRVIASKPQWLPLPPWESGHDSGPIPLIEGTYAMHAERQNQKVIGEAWCLEYTENEDEVSLI